MSISPLFGQLLDGSDKIEEVRKKKIDIDKIINENVNMVQKIVDSNGKIDANNEFDVVKNGNTNDNNVVNLKSNSNNTNTNTNTNKVPPANNTNNSTNSASKPQNPTSTAAGNSDTTNANKSNTNTNSRDANNSTKDPAKLADTLIKKVYRATTK